MSTCFSKFLPIMNILHRGMDMAARDMDQGSSMVPHLPIRPIPTVAATGASRVAGVDQDSSSGGVAATASNHGVDLGTAPAVAKGGRLCCCLWALFYKCVECMCVLLSTYTDHTYFMYKKSPVFFYIWFPSFKWNFLWFEKVYWKHILIHFKEILLWGRLAVIF